MMREQPIKDPYKLEEDLDVKFEDAVRRGNMMPTQTADNMLRAYAYYKQATVGDCNENYTGNMNIVTVFKQNAWRSLNGMDKIEAKKRYIEFINWLEKEGERS
ncbi:MAG: acyl-CoA-binding protein [Cytophagales bacterium]